MPNTPYSNSASHAAAILEFALSHDKAALCILTEVSGGTLRRRGAMMALTASGSLGYISNGCVDGDILFQAQQALTDGQPRVLRYGDGSPFKDITLPCGGAIEIAVIPRYDPAVLKKALTSLTARRAAELSITQDKTLISGLTGAHFSCVYNPSIRLRIAGRGEAALQLALQGRAAGFDIILQSPDRDVLGLVPDSRFIRLLDPLNVPSVHDDRWTAIALLFHDHDWETALLVQAVGGLAFYVGAMGSERTHHTRIKRLEAQGVSPEKIAKVHGPIGLIPAMRDANLLALSILAEIITEAEKSMII